MIYLPNTLLHQPKVGSKIKLELICNYLLGSATFLAGSAVVSFDITRCKLALKAPINAPNEISKTSVIDMANFVIVSYIFSFDGGNINREMCIPTETNIAKMKIPR
ncbi:hypothetical protein QUF74_03090 [Candidatus Halobeggiatoa sp. HSG11]|nr:hypothetical protein [Candidatus Halobeggiatoa sp. HSG11]